MCVSVAFPFQPEISVANSSQFRNIPSMLSTRSVFHFSKPTPSKSLQSENISRIDVTELTSQSDKSALNSVNFTKVALLFRLLFLPSDAFLVDPNARSMLVTLLTSQVGIAPYFGNCVHIPSTGFVLMHCSMASLNVASVNASLAFELFSLLASSAQCAPFPNKRKADAVAATRTR